MTKSPNDAFLKRIPIANRRISLCQRTISELRQFGSESGNLRTTYMCTCSLKMDSFNVNLQSKILQAFLISLHSLYTSLVLSLLI